jgi:putative ABC transport system substrate-binding protein
MVGSLAAWPAWAQMPRKQNRIAVVTTGVVWRSLPIFRAFFAELGHLGYVEGQDLAIEDFTINGRVEREAEVARQVVASKPDAILCPGEFPPVLLSETSTIPIVVFTVDPLTWGFTDSLGHPPGNLTGVSFYDVDFVGKQLELLKEAVPSVSRIAVLMTQQITEVPAFASWRPKLREYAAALSISLIEMVLSDWTPHEIERGFAELVQNHPDALLLNAESAPDNPEPIIRLAEANRLPTMYPYPVYIEHGGLMAYTADVAELGRRLADDVRRILQGVRPVDIPFYRATHYKFIVNLKAAKAIGFTFPPSVLTRADEAIE